MKENVKVSLLCLIVGILAGGSGLYWFLSDDFQTASNLGILFGALRVLFGLLGVVVGVKGILQNEKI